MNPCVCGHSLNQHERNCPGDGGAPCEECSCSGFEELTGLDCDGKSFDVSPLESSDG